MDIDGLPADDERIDRIVVDQHDLDIVGRQAGGDDHLPRHVLEQRLCLGVAQDRLGTRRLHPDQDQRGEDGEVTLHMPIIRPFAPSINATVALRPDG